MIESLATTSCYINARFSILHPPRQNAMVRRFRRGKDCALANAYQGGEPRLEFTIGLTLLVAGEMKMMQTLTLNRSRRRMAIPRKRMEI